MLRQVCSDNLAFINDVRCYITKRHFFVIIFTTYFVSLCLSQQCAFHNPTKKWPKNKAEGITNCFVDSPL